MRDYPSNPLLQNLTAAIIEEAIKQYRKGQKPPFALHPPKHWFIFFDQNLFPLKNIVAIALDQPARTFNVGKALARLEVLGFKCVDTRKSEL